MATMSRRRALKTMGAASGFALSGLAKRSWASSIGQPANVVVIVCDDMRADDLNPMPQIQALLAREGVSFTNAYVSNPICGPSRASYLTGMYPHSTGIWGNGDDKVPTAQPKGGWAGMQKFDLEDRMIGVHLQAAGYYTGFFGKYMNHYTAPADHKPAGWNVWHPFATPPYPGADSSHEIFKQARDFVLSAGTVPFFAILNVVPPHYPNKPEEKYARAFDGKPFVPRPSFDEADNEDKPEHIRSLPHLSVQKRDEIIQTWRDRMSSLLSVDDMVENLINFLRSVGQLDNTYIMITSDNGWQHGEHRLDSSKGQPYQESSNVPLIVRGPGVPKGRSLPHLVTLVDLLPTLCEIAQLSPASHFEGKSWVPLLGATAPLESSWRRSLLVEDDSFRMIRYREDDVDAVYIRYAWTEEEVYDMNRDPYQMDNVIRIANGSASASQLSVASTNVLSRIDVMRSELNRLVGCDGMGCRT